MSGSRRRWNRLANHRRPGVQAGRRRPAPEHRSCHKDHTTYGSYEENQSHQSHRLCTLAGEHDASLADQRDARLDETLRRWHH